MCCKDDAIKIFNEKLKTFEDEKKKEERNVKISSKISGLNPYLDEN